MLSFTPLSSPLHTTSRDSHLLCTKQFNGCLWQGTRLVVGRAKEAFKQRLHRERQAAQHAAAATAAALEERRRQIAAAPVDVAELDRQLQNTELWLRGPGGKVRLRATCIAAVRRCRGNSLATPVALSQWVSVGACGGLGSHKRSFQRYQPDAAAAGAPDAGLGRHASFRAAAQTAADVAGNDPWARLFRKVSVLDDIDDQPDDADFLESEDQAEEDVRDEYEPAGVKVAVEPPAAVQAKPPPVLQVRSVAAVREKASAAPEAVPRRAARQPTDAPVPKPVAASAPPEQPRAPRVAPVEVYTAQARDDAVAGERAQQLALLARLGFGGGAYKDTDAAAHRVVAAPRVARPVAHGFSSSSEEGAGEPEAADDAGAVQSQEEEEVLPNTAAPPRAQKAAKPRRTPQPRAATVVLADDAAWGRALRLAAGEEVEGDDEAAPQVEAPPPAEPPRKRRRSRVKQAAGAGEGDAAAAAAPGPEEEARAARVRQALAASRLGEGRTGVYFADTAFDWRSLAVEAGQQTWSLLGGGAEGGTSPLPASAVDAEPTPMQAPPAAVVLPPAQAFKPVDLAALGASFTRHGDGAGDAKAAWQAHRDVLWADVKRKKREVKRKR